MDLNYTSSYRTQTHYSPCSNLFDGGDIWPIALDVGYSGVKGLSPNSVYCFPSFARELDAGLLGNDRSSDILYRDEDGQEWMIGDLALSSLHADDTTDSQTTLYGRHRYFSNVFRVITRVGIAMGMQSNKYGQYTGQKLYLQTGLPPAYLKADTPLLREALSGRHKFSVKFGAKKWKEYEFELNENDIGVISQPMGAVISASKTDGGKTVLGANKKPFVEDRIIVVDGGFGTFDAISIYNRVVEGNGESFTDVGMHSVLSALSERLLERYSVNISVHALQSTLEAGYVFAFDRSSRANRKVDISELLAECSREICNRALDKLDSSFNYLQNYRYLLATGGTCAAWLPYIKERYVGMQSLDIITGDQNDTLGPVFSNARGYYIYCVLALKSTKNR
jgi:plasmid segregation protein ParM